MPSRSRSLLPARAYVPVLVALLATVPSALARQAAPPALDPALRITQYVHNAWQNADGLPQNSVFAVTQTRDGYLWIGTQEGLARFDGVNFDVFEKTRDGLLSSEIHALAEAPDGTLWIGTGGGLTRYANGSFTTYTKADGLSEDEVRTLFLDRTGTLWIGTIGGGVTRFDGTDFVHFTTQHGLPDDNVLAFAESVDGTLWIGTYGGLSRLRGDHIVPLEDDAWLPGHTIRALHVAPADSALWIGTDEGLVRLTAGNPTVYTSDQGLCGDMVSSLYYDQAGTLWIGTLDGGLCRYAHGRFAAFTPEDGLTHPQVRALFQGREGSLWIGTEGGGLNRLWDGKFTPISASEGLSNRVATTVMEDRSGIVWIGTDGGGLNQLQGDEVRHYGAAEGLPSGYVYALHEAPGGPLWAGTYGGGACRLEGGRFRCLSAADGLSSDNVFSMESADGGLWVGTDAGLDRIEAGRIHNFSTEDGLTSEIITALLASRDGTLWIGTFTGGLNRYRAGRFEAFGEADGLTSDRILTLMEDEQGVLWVGTMGAGLCRRDGRRYSCFSAEDGLPDNVLQILEDDHGYLWLGTNNGIARLRKAHLAAYANGGLARIPLTVYGTADGLKSVETNGGWQPAAWKARSGKLWFSTLAGAAVIDPAQLSINPVPPPVILEQFLVDDRAVSLAETAELPPGSKNFEFDYAGLSFAAPKQVRFKYQLEGNDADWVDAGTRRSAFYTNLPAGSYTFRVIASNNDGIWNEQGASVSFQVAPYFYKTPWFYVAASTGLFLLLMGGHRLRIRHLHARERMLQTLVDEQTRKLRMREQELESLNKNLAREVQRQLDLILAERMRYERALIAAKDKAEESARLKSSILMNMSHEIRTPITVILGSAQVLAKEVPPDQEEFIQYITDNGRRLLDTLNSILDFARFESEGVALQARPFDLSGVIRDALQMLTPMAKEKGVTLRSTLPDVPVVARLDEGAVERILQNLIDNAIKFTDEGEVVVSASTRGAKLLLEVRDTGIGISPSFLPHIFEEFKQESSGLTRGYGGSGLGLAITQRLVRSMGGEITVASEKGKGAIFTVTFPHAVAQAQPESNTVES